jgi:hypothetical protein
MGPAKPRRRPTLLSYRRWGIKGEYRSYNSPRGGMREFPLPDAAGAGKAERLRAEQARASDYLPGDRIVPPVVTRGAR